MLIVSTRDLLHPRAHGVRYSVKDEITLVSRISLHQHLAPLACLSKGKLLWDDKHRRTIGHGRRQSQGRAEVEETLQAPLVHLPVVASLLDLVETQHSGLIGKRRGRAGDRAG